MTTVHTDYKFVIAVNKTIDVGVAMNAATHVALSIAAQASDEQKKLMSFITYEDGAGIAHPSISGLSLIVLRGKNGELKKLVNAARDQGMLHADFIETMTGDTYVEQLERTKATQEPTYYAVAVFGKKEVIDPLTKRFSLYK